MPCSSPSSLFDQPHNIWWGVQIIKLHIPSFSALPCYLVPLRPKYSQHPILKHPQPTSLPQCVRPSFTRIQHNRKYYSSTHLNLYTFGQQTGRRKTLHRMIASIPWLQSALNFLQNRILICLNCSQIFELLHPFKGTIINLHTVTFPAFWSRDMAMYLVLSTFTSSPIFLLATIKASAFSFTVCMLPPTILTS